MIANAHQQLSLPSIPAWTLFTPRFQVTIVTLTLRSVPTPAISLVFFDGVLRTFISLFVSTSHHSVLSFAEHTEDRVCIQCHGAHFSLTPKALSNLRAP